LWHVATGKRLRTYEVNDYALGPVAYHPEGEAIAVATSYDIRMYETQSEEEVSGFSPPEVSVATVLRFTSGGATVDSLEYGGRWLRINAANGLVQKSCSHPDGYEVTTQALSPDATTVASATDGGVLLWGIAAQAK
jgi:WD40 repeat protein